MNDVREEKQRLRDRMRALRRAEPDPDGQSRRLFARLEAMPEFQTAQTVLFYVGVRDELPTLAAIEAGLHCQRTIAVPYCEGRHLKLATIKSLDDLGKGAFGILEPREELRDSQQLAPSAVDVALVPGVAFDQSGNRIGYGQGYYDRLLSELRVSCLKIGVAFDCQVVPHVPSEPHDQQMDWNATPTQSIRCRSESSNE